MSRRTMIVSNRKLRSQLAHSRRVSLVAASGRRIQHPNLNRSMSFSSALRSKSIARTRSVARSRSISRSSIGSARSRSRSESPMYPKTHFRKSTHHHGPLQKDSIPTSYNINREISNLAAQFSKSRRRELPPINVPVTSGSPQWPVSIPVYAISINPSRQEKFKKRFLHPSIIWDGTKGKTMDVGKLKREGILISSHLTRGEIGCYDSHLRLWEKLIRDKTSMAIICEDDVNLTGDSTQARYLNTLLEEVKDTPFDIIFLSWFRPAGGSNITTHTHQQWCFHQLWAYLVTYEGLKKVLSDVKVKKMHVPVDVALWESHSRGVVRNLVAYPPLCLTVGEHSDTRGIR